MGAFKRKGMFLAPFLRNLNRLNDLNTFCTKRCRLVYIFVHLETRIRKCCPREIPILNNQPLLKFIVVHPSLGLVIVAEV